MKGKIEKIVADKNYGWIKGENEGRYRFKANAAETFPDLKEGMEVTFEGTAPTSGQPYGPAQNVRPIPFDMNSEEFHNPYHFIPAEAKVPEAFEVDKLKKNYRQLRS